MSKTTYTAGVDLFLVDGEIYITQPHDYGEEKTIYSTKKIQYCLLLDRNMFVKGEDLDVIALNKFGIDDVEELCTEEFHYFIGFKAGYKANKNEFTLEGMQKAFMAGIKSVTIPGTWFRLFDEFISELRPISLPFSVTIENNEIIEVKWS